MDRAKTVASEALRPTPEELQHARALIKRMKAADRNLRKADELLVCAAVACRAGEFGGVPTTCARKMGKDITKPKSVTDWVARLDRLDARPSVPTQLAAPHEPPLSPQPAEPSLPMPRDRQTPTPPSRPVISPQQPSVAITEVARSSRESLVRPVYAPVRTTNTPGGTRQRVFVSNATKMEPSTIPFQPLRELNL